MPTIAYKFYGQNTVDDQIDVGAPVPKIRQLIFTEGVSLVNADPDNDGGCVLRPGYVSRAPGNVPSMFANDDIFLFQDGTSIKRLDPVAYTSTFIHLTLAGTAVFCDVNGLIVYSDGTVIRKIYQGADYPLTTPTEQFKLPTPAGQCLAVFYRRLLVGVDDVLCACDPDTVDQMDERFCYFPLGGILQMIAPVDDGVYVSTDKVIYFLGGKGPWEWSQPGQVRKVADYPAIKGTDVRFKADKTGLDKVDGNICMFATEQGFCYGLNGGMLLNVTQDKNRPGVQTSGAAVLREANGLFHYLAVLLSGSTYSGYVMNTKTQGVAEYQGYNFKSLACYQGRYFGGNASGIFELTGTTDAGADIDASGLSGVSTAGTDKVKYFPDAYLTLRCEGKLDFSVAVDEQTAVSYSVEYAEGREGIHKKRRKLAKGVTGGQVQVGWNNVDGCDFTLQQIELDVIPSNSRRAK